MKKGLRREPERQVRSGSGSDSCPDEEGIKTRPRPPLEGRSSCSDSCPDEEGIKTCWRHVDHPAIAGSDSCPDEEGIKTMGPYSESTCERVRTLALMKKGLRPVSELLFDRIERSDSCPDEEGIKTPHCCPCARRPPVRTLALMKKGLRPRICWRGRDGNEEFGLLP